jgi:hypothetical protein
LGIGPATDKDTVMKFKILALGAGLALAAGAVALAADENPGQRTEERVVIVTGGPGGPSGHRAEMDANNDGAITREEFRAMHDKMFAKMDKNGDGKLSDDEFGAHHGPGGEQFNIRIEGPDGPGPHGPHGPGGAMWTERHGPEGGRPGEDVTIIRHGPGDGPGEMDRNKDGKVSFDEFTGPLREHFQAADKNKDGFLDKDEMGGEHVFMFRRTERNE